MVSHEDVGREEVEEMKRIIIRLCREQPRAFSPLGAGETALTELKRDGYVREEHGINHLTDKGQRI